MYARHDCGYRDAIVRQKLHLFGRLGWTNREFQLGNLDILDIASLRELYEFAERQISYRELV